jgi:hypothetical protein
VIDANGDIDAVRRRDLERCLEPARSLMAFDPDDLPHPRDDLHARTASSRRLRPSSSRWTADRLHHAWLLTGPEGAGKASFAYRAARRLLGARPDPA